MDTSILDDLVIFAKIEQESNDIEPWADIIKVLSLNGADNSLDEEETLWLLKLYNAYNDISSAWKVFEECPSPKDWHKVDHVKVAQYFISRERRNLYGGRVIKHLNSYVGLLGDKSQVDWTFKANDFRGLYNHLSEVWGTGRLSAFEWVEFLAKVTNAPIVPQDALLWESSGPRQSLERIYGNDAPTPRWLKETAEECKEHLAKNGVVLSWWDFETVICDFNVMRKGRYYPGKHIAMLREEIYSLQEPRLREAFNTVIPAKWQKTPLDKALYRLYADKREMYENSIDL